MLLSPSLTLHKLPGQAVIRRAAITLALAGLIAGCDRQSGTAGQPDVAASTAAPDAEPAPTLDRSHNGAAIPAVTVHDSAGKTLALGTLAGAPVLVNLWATWCAPCVHELPALARLAATGRIRVVTISEDMGEPAKAAAFIAAKGAGHLPGWLDPDNAASAAFGVQTLPTSILYDAAGHEIWRVEGGRDWDDAASGKLIAEAK